MSVRTLKAIVDLAVDLADDTTRQVWIQIAKAGTFRGHSAGPFELNDRVFGEMVANFRATNNRRIAVDFEHASEADATSGGIPVHGAPAQAWILDLDNRGTSLWGLVEWLEPARSYVKEGKYRFFSPSIRFGARDRVTGKPIGAVLTSGGLTNQPFLDGMAPLAAKDTITAEDPAAGDPEMDFEKLYKESQDKVAALTAKVEQLTSERADLQLSLKDATATKDADSKELVTLRAYKTETDERFLSERVDLAFDTYKDAKKLTDDDKEAMKIVLKADATRFEKLYPKVDATKQHLLRNVTDHRETSSGTTLSVIEGGAGNAIPVGETFSQTTKRLMRERKLPYADAQNLALQLRNA